MSGAEPIANLPGRPLSLAIYMSNLGGGGVERQCLSLAGELQAAGLTVSLVVNRVQGELVDQIPNDLRVVELGGRRTLHDIFILARLLRRERPDIVLTSLDHNNVAGVLAKIVAYCGTKVIISQHNALSGEFACGERWTYRYIPLAYGVLSPFIASAVAVSDGIAGELASTARLPRGKVVTIHNAVIRDDFQDRASQQVTHPWFSDDAPVFVNAGRLVPQKDHQTLLRALALHRRGGGRGRLLVLGTGPLQDCLQDQARTEGIEDIVEFLGFRSNPLPWFGRADACVLSARSEGFGNVLVEAMGCGTPVISTDCDYGPREILEGGRYGLLVPPRDPAALANALSAARYLRSRFPAELLKERAARFTNAACAAAYRNLFAKVMTLGRHGQQMEADTRQ